MNPNKLMVASTVKVTIIVVIGTILLGCQPEILRLPGITPTPKVIAPSKQITSNTLPLEERWRWSGISNSVSKLAIAITKNRIAIIEGVGFEQRVHVFDVHTGNSLWTNQSKETGIRSITADERRIYIGTITDVQAFDLESGERLWQGAVQPSLHRGGFAVFCDGDWVLAYDGIEPDLYILNAATGQTIQKITNPDLFYRWNDKVDYLLNKSHRYLEAQDIQTGKKLWGQQFAGTIIDTAPVFFENTMILKIAHQFRGLVGVDIKSGNIKWEISDKFRFLDVAGLDNLAYALRYDASIVGLNPETGEQVGVIEMTPNRTGEDDGGFATYYGITTSDRYAVVYYGNSQELIVFERIENTNEDK